MKYNVLILEGFMIFCRICITLFFIPLIGEKSINKKARVYLGLILSILIYISSAEVNKQLQSLSYDSNILLFYTIIIQEIIIGAMIGLIIRFIFLAMHTAGSIISAELGLSSASMFDPYQQLDSTYITTLLSFATITLLTSLDIHLLCIKGIESSYTLIPINSLSYKYSNLLDILISTLSKSWNIALSISAPFIIANIILIFAAGVLSRLMPQLQMFLIIIPAQILLGILIASIGITITLKWFIDYYQELLTQIF